MCLDIAIRGERAVVDWSVHILADLSQTTSGENPKLLFCFVLFCSVLFGLSGFV